jgi:hypothetical protein
MGSKYHTLHHTHYHYNYGQVNNETTEQYDTMKMTDSSNVWGLISFLHLSMQLLPGDLFAFI